MKYEVEYWHNGSYGIGTIVDHEQRDGKDWYLVRDGNFKEWIRYDDVREYVAPALYPYFN